jgi:protein lifeguard
LCLQLAITLGMIAVFVFYEPANQYIKGNFMLVLIAMVLSLVVAVVLVCCSSVRRSSPANIICLLIFTLLEGVVLAGISAITDAETVMMAVGLTALVSLSLTVFAFQTRWDFTVSINNCFENVDPLLLFLLKVMGGMLFVAGIILMVFGIAAIFIHDKIFKLVYASLGALLFCFYLIYDTQLMMGEWLD